MKKIRCFTLLVIVMALGMCISSCKKEEKSDNLSDLSSENDVVGLEDVLTAQYDIRDLIDFFENCNLDEGTLFGNQTVPLSFSDVDEVFPVEIVRPGGYSVYKVVQGGYYYVFWVDSLSTDTNQSNHDRFVYSTTYLPANSSKISIDSIQPGKSTADEVKKIDPYMEMNLLLSKGVYSYSYLDKENLIEIEYKHQKDISNSKDLIVHRITIVERESTPSRYCAVLSQDFP